MKLFNTLGGSPAHKTRESNIEAWIGSDTGLTPSIDEYLFFLELSKKFDDHQKHNSPPIDFRDLLKAHILLG